MGLPHGLVTVSSREMSADEQRVRALLGASRTQIQPQRGHV